MLSMSVSVSVSLSVFVFVSVDILASSASFQCIFEVIHGTLPFQKPWSCCRSVEPYCSPCSADEEKETHVGMAGLLFEDGEAAGDPGYDG